MMKYWRLIMLSNTSLNKEPRCFWNNRKLIKCTIIITTWCKCIRKRNKSRRNYKISMTRSLPNFKSLKKILSLRLMSQTNPKMSWLKTKLLSQIKLISSLWSLMSRKTSEINCNLSKKSPNSCNSPESYLKLKSLKSEINLKRSKRRALRMVRYLSIKAICSRLKMKVSTTSLSWQSPSNNLKRYNATLMNSRRKIRNLSIKSKRNKISSIFNIYLNSPKWFMLTWRFDTKA